MSYHEEELDKLPPSHPFGAMDGSELSLDGTPTKKLQDEDLDKVLWAWSSPEGGDGCCAAVCRLVSGHYVAWESWWGPTGNGFCEDAYGGDSVVYFARDLGSVARLGLTPDVRQRFYREYTDNDPEHVDL